MSSSTDALRTHSDHETPNGLLATIQYGLREFGLLGSAYRFLAQIDDQRRFLAAAGSPEDRRRRKELLGEFSRIHSAMTCAHSPGQFTTVASLLEGFDVPGPMVLCGCFKGGSAAKLSVLAERTGRRLIVCDSFEGLPAVAESTEAKKGFAGRLDYEFAAGEYAGALEEVQENVRRHGRIEVCEFVKGWFSDSLPSLDVAPAFVFIDVDYVSSGRDCLQHLWPRTVPGGLWMTHEASFVDYLEGIFDRDWWGETLNEAPPLVWGAGTGLSPASPSIAYFNKPGGTPSYLVLHARAGLNLGERTEVTLGLENLTDEDYRFHGSGSNQPGFGVLLAVSHTF